MNWIERLKYSGKYVAMGNIIINKAIKKISHPWISVIALILLFAAFLLSYLIPCPTRTQYILLRLVVSIGIVVVILPFIGQVKWGKHNLKGALMLLVLLFTYLVNPASVIKQDSCDNYIYENGKILLGDDPLEGAKVSLPYHDYKTLSNGAGEFALRWEREETQDSLLVAVEANGIDTSFYWFAESPELTVQLKDTILPITKSILTDLVEQRKERFEKRMQAHYRKWETQTPIKLEQLDSIFKPFDMKNNKYRNYYHYYGIDRELEFRVKLDDAGIKEVKELKPYQKHLFDSCDIYLLKYRAFPQYQLEYLMVNREPLSYKMRQAKHLSDDHYTAKVAYQANIRCIRVLLECSANTDNYKIREIEFYGFLPLEEYDFHFQHGEWEITSTKQLS